MKWILIIGGTIISLVAIVYLIGLLLPVKHSATIEEVIPVNVEKVWDRITKVAAFSSWREGLDRIEITNDTEWTEVSGRNRIPMKVTEKIDYKRLVTMIDSKDLPFGGAWVYSLQPKGDSTLLTITENGEVYNPVFRFVSRFIMGHKSTLNKYMSSLKASFL